MLPRTLGPYELLSPLGQGGMGTVFRARRQRGGITQEVALKLMNVELSGQSRMEQLFRREAQALASLNHRGILKLLDFEREGETLYLATELLAGVDWRTLAQADPGRLSWALAAFVGAEVAWALAAAHELRSPDAPDGLVHGDVSLSNVMVCEDGAVKLLDFGLARPSGSERSSPNLEGKLAYLPPEVVAGATKDALTDVYGLGVSLYACLAGQNPAQASNAGATVARVIQGTFPQLRELRPDVPAALNDVIHAMLERDRGRRPARARDVATQLDALARGHCGVLEAAAAVRALRPVSAAAPKTAATPVSRVTAAQEAESHGSVVPVAGVAPNPRRPWPVIVGLLVLVSVALAWRVMPAAAPAVADARAPDPLPAPPAPRIWSFTPTPPKRPWWLTGPPWRRPSTVPSLTWRQGSNTSWSSPVKTAAAPRARCRARRGRSSTSNSTGPR